MAYYPPPQPVYAGPRYSGCMKFILYIASFFIPLVGIIAAIIFMSRQDPESKRLANVFDPGYHQFCPYLLYSYWRRCS